MTSHSLRLIRKNWLARSVIAGAVLASFAMGAGAQVSTPVPPLPASLHELGRAVLGELIAVNTTATYGSTEAARRMADRLRAAGFSDDDMQLLWPASHPERANLVVRLRGSGKARPVLYIGHLDVVEALRADWSMDPFVLNQQDGWLYGRGTIDMKGQDSAMLVSLIAMKQQQFVPDRDIIVALTADEEHGDANGVQWLLANHRPLVDAEFAINPDGGEAGLVNGKHQYLVMQTSEKIYVSFRVTATDKGGHSSRPTPENPIYRLARALQHLSVDRFPVHLTDTSRQHFARLALQESGQRRRDMLQLATTHPDPAAVTRLARDLNIDILLRTTCTATMIEGGHAENALPQRASAIVQCRVVPGESMTDVQARLMRVMQTPGLTIAPVDAVTLSPESPPRADLLNILEQTVHEKWPGVLVLPQMSPGASDSIYTRAAGIPTYGIDAMFSDVDDDRFHGRDERIGVAEFDDEMDFTYALMRRLAMQH